MTLLGIINEVVKASPMTKSDLARTVGISVASMNNKLSEAIRKDISSSDAAKYLDILGYQLVVMPKGKKAPAGSYVVEPRDE